MSIKDQLVEDGLERDKTSLSREESRCSSLFLTKELFLEAPLGLDLMIIAMPST